MLFRFAMELEIGIFYELCCFCSFVIEIFLLVVAGFQFLGEWLLLQKDRDLVFFGQFFSPFMYGALFLGTIFLKDCIFNMVKHFKQTREIGSVKFAYALLVRLSKTSAVTREGMAVANEDLENLL